MTMNIPMNSLFLQIRWMSNDEKNGIGLSVEFDRVIAQYDEQTVKEYLEIVKREGMDELRDLREEVDCVAVLEMLKCIGRDMSPVTDTEYVELFLNTHSISVCQ